MKIDKQTQINRAIQAIEANIRTMNEPFQFENITKIASKTINDIIKRIKKELGVIIKIEYGEVFVVDTKN